MDFLRDYLLYNEGNECPAPYHQWAALSVLANAVGPKVCFPRGYFKIYCNFYACLVGDAGSRKTTAKDIALGMVMDTLPDLPLNASVETKDALTNYIASDDCVRAWKDPTGQLHEFHPCGLFLNEMKNFFSYSPGAMIDFLTDIYDRTGKPYSCRTIKRKTEIIQSPYINMLGCTTPDWFRENMKEKFIAGGFARRVVIVYEAKHKRIPDPKPSDEGKKAWARAAAHVLKVRDNQGDFSFSPEAWQWFSDWYVKLEPPKDNHLLQQAYSTKDSLLLKVAMLVHMSSYSAPTYVIDVPTFEFALALIDSTEGGIPKLTIGSGMNEYAQPVAKVLEVLEQAGGIMAEKTIRKMLWNDLPGHHIDGVFYQLGKMGLIQRFRGKDEATGTERDMVATEAAFEVLSKRKQTPQ